MSPALVNEQRYAQEMERIVLALDARSRERFLPPWEPRSRQRFLPPREPRSRQRFLPPREPRKRQTAGRGLPGQTDRPAHPTPVQAGRPIPSRPGLHLTDYRADSPRAVIVISHGFTESARKYAELVWYFLQAGLWVYLPEHCGHGESYRLTEDPSLVHVDTPERYIGDFLAAARLARREHPGLPLILFGHSMGGGIGAAAAARCPQLFQALILSSPMIQPSTGGVPYPAAVAAARAACLLGRAKSYAAGQHPYAGLEDFAASASTSAARFDWYQAIKAARPSCQTSAPSYGWLRAAAAMSHELKTRSWKTADVPLLLFQAEQDTFVSLAAQRRFAHLRNRRRPGSTALVSVPGSKHEIFTSPNQVLTPYLDAIRDFIR